MMHTMHYVHKVLMLVNNRGDILDRMLTNKRYFDTNVASTFVIGDNVKDMSNEETVIWQML